MLIFFHCTLWDVQVKLAQFANLLFWINLVPDFKINNYIYVHINDFQSFFNVFCVKKDVLNFLSEQLLWLKIKMF